MSPNLLHPLNIITQLRIEILGKYLGILSRLEILLPIQEPTGNLELTGILDNGHEFFNLVGGEFTRTLVHVDFGFFAD
eukprot:CAMPEP_0198256924 /NCGR_PEP_ID=MMETSP1447-20131203/6712_1 /TAXON_ID=420782 /ORGANISM="Chaetoceros dichaeta, Strain CCMP1751" /LENGTH=77 /DNA_ID=CAMNT_0043943683 /DNA_START=207 /DNA_END=440 /DNA_ORIENTATION=+